MKGSIIAIPGLETRENEIPVTLLVAAFSILTVVAAQARIFLPFSPVPVTLQTMVVMLAGLVLAQGAAMMSQILYVIAGISGLPVIAAAGPHTFGYLAGFVLAAPLISYSAARRHPVIGCVGGVAVIHFLGCAGLASMSNGGFSVAGIFVIGSFPFIPGEMIKCALALGIVGSIRKRWLPKRS